VVNEAVLTRGDGSTAKLLKATGIALEPGDRLTFGTAGGGGWGDPRQRDRKHIEQDIIAGYVSPEAARRDYGYVPGRASAAE
jgi:N-methylhydantoinase B